MAITNSIRKVLFNLNKKHPGILKYLVAEPKYWDLEPPKYFVPSDHEHPTASSLPDVDYTTPDPGVRELDGAVAKEGFHYWTRDRRRGGPRAVTREVAVGSADELLEELRQLQGEALVQAAIKDTNPLYGRILDSFAQTLHFEGRPSLHFPNNKDTTGVLAEAEEEFYLTRYHDHPVHEAWLAEQHQKLDAAASSRVIQ